MVLRLDRRVQAYLRGPALGSIRIVAAPAMIRVGSSPGRDELLAALARLGYVSAHAPLASGGLDCLDTQLKER